MGTIRQDLASRGQYRWGNHPMNLLPEDGDQFHLISGTAALMVTSLKTVVDSTDYVLVY